MSPAVSFLWSSGTKVWTKMPTSMYDVLSEQFKRIVKYLHLQEVRIDNAVFQLHYVVRSNIPPLSWNFFYYFLFSVVIFVVYSLLVTINTYAGDPIDCISNNEDLTESDYIDWYCYIHGTKSLQIPKTPSESAHETVGSCVDPGDCETHTHYMWVSLVILVQAGLSYLPHYLWHSWEEGRMRQMLANIMETPRFFHDNKDNQERRNTICCPSSTDSEETFRTESLHNSG